MRKFGVLCKLIQIWIFLISVVSGLDQDSQPRFIESPTNVTERQGQNASFTCMVSNLGANRMAWIKGDTTAILAIHHHVITRNPRISVRTSMTTNGTLTSTLHIRGALRSDRGIYKCQINTTPMVDQMAFLEVVISPDIILDPGNLVIVPEGGAAKLICQDKGQPNPSITWRKESNEEFFVKDDQGGRKKVNQYEGEVLELSDITRSDMGAYLCIASNGVPPAMSKRVILLQVYFAPEIQVPNMYIPATIGFDVLLECVAEASPKDQNYWMRESGEVIIDNNDKFNISEKPISLYGVRMYLLIRNLTERDFSGYKCISQNSKGKAEGTIHIHADNKYNESDEFAFTEHRELSTQVTLAESPPFHQPTDITPSLSNLLVPHLATILLSLTMELVLSLLFFT